MENTDICIIRYANPALSYLPKIGSLLHEVMKTYHNKLIKFGDIELFIVSLNIKQGNILSQNPRLKPIRIDRHDTDDRIRIDTPINNNDPEELFEIEPIAGYMYDLTPKLEIKEQTVLETMLQQRLDVLRHRKRIMDCDVARSGEYNCSTDPEQHTKVTNQIEGLEDLQEIIAGKRSVTN